MIAAVVRLVRLAHCPRTFCSQSSSHSGADALAMQDDTKKQKQNTNVH